MNWLKKRDTIILIKMNLQLTAIVAFVEGETNSIQQKSQLQNTAGF